MTYPLGAVTVPCPSFRDPALQAWAMRLFDWAQDIQKRVNAIDAEARKATADPIADLSLASITDPADTPADADALRDDLVNNTIPSIEARLASIQTFVNDLKTALETNLIVGT